MGGVLIEVLKHGIPEGFSRGETSRTIRGGTITKENNLTYIEDNDMLNVCIFLDRLSSVSIKELLSYHLEQY